MKLVQKQLVANRVVVTQLMVQRQTIQQLLASLGRTGSVKRRKSEWMMYTNTLSTPIK
jgi:hypothetical protein